MKRIVLAVMALLLTALVFTGCSEKGGQRTTETGLDISRQVELVLYVIGNAPPKQDELTENFNKIALERLNCTLKIKWLSWGEYRNKYPLIFASGESFDMAYGATWLNFASLAKRGAFKNLDELFPKYAPNNYAKQSKTALMQATVDGSIYAVPTLLATYSVYGPIYRADLALPYGWDGKMETFEDMENFLKIIKDNYPAVEPLTVDARSCEMDDLWLYYHGIYPIKGSTNDFLFIDPTQPNPKLFTYWEYEKTPEFLEMMARWNRAGYFPKSGLADQDSEKILNGKTALRLHNMDTWETYYRDHPEWDFKYSNYTKDVSYLAYTQDAMVISNSCKNPERAMALYDLITSEEDVFRNFFYGIEGKSYEIQIIEGQEYVKALNIEDYAFSNLWAARTKEFTLPLLGSPPELPALKAGYDAVIQDGVNAQKFRSFVIDTSSIETEYSNCISVHQQYWWPLELAYVDTVSGLAEYRDKMLAAGIERIRETLQKQLDEYLANFE
ncbi:MAG: ABC transporter substrate-binding protein [Treponema sp.]|nr:ABC transporter substrate-binding protein [Treponema sp.]